MRVVAEDDARPVAGGAARVVLRGQTGSKGQPVGRPLETRTPPGRRGSVPRARVLVSLMLALALHKGRGQRDGCHDAGGRVRGLAGVDGPRLEAEPFALVLFPHAGRGQAGPAAVGRGEAHVGAGSGPTAAGRRPARGAGAVQHLDRPRQRLAEADRRQLRAHHLVHRRVEDRIAVGGVHQLELDRRPLAFLNDGSFLQTGSCETPVDRIRETASSHGLLGSLSNSARGPRCGRPAPRRRTGRALAEEPYVAIHSSLKARDRYPRPESGISTTTKRRPRSQATLIAAPRRDHRRSRGGSLPPWPPGGPSGRVFFEQATTWSRTDGSHASGRSPRRPPRWNRAVRAAREDGTLGIGGDHLDRRADPLQVPGDAGDRPARPRHEVGGAARGLAPDLGTGRLLVGRGLAGLAYWLGRKAPGISFTSRSAVE